MLPLRTGKEERVKQVLVTGGAGFVGSWVVRQLVEKGVTTRVLALPDEPTDNLEGVDPEIVRGNVLDRDDCARSISGCDTLFHIAAVYKAWMPDPTPMYTVNLRGTFNMLEAARREGVQTTVYTASIVSLGRSGPKRLADESEPYDAWDIDFAYSRSKYHSRRLAEDFAAWGSDVRIVCPGVVLGPGDIGPTPSGQLIINSLQGGPPVVFEGGMSYVDVRDAANVHVLAAEKGKPGETYIASAHNLSNADFSRAIRRAAGLPERRPVKVPAKLIQSMVSGMEAIAKRTGKPPLITRAFIDYSLKASYYSNRKAVEELGAEFRPIDETIRDAMDYFRGRGMLSGS